MNIEEPMEVDTAASDDANPSDSGDLSEDSGDLSEDSSDDVELPDMPNDDPMDKKFHLSRQITRWDDNWRNFQYKFCVSNSLNFFG